MILPLTGQQYSEKVAENCVAIWKSLGRYTDAESKAIEQFIKVFKDENFPPGASILFTISPLGSLTVSKIYIKYKYKWKTEDRPDPRVYSCMEIAN